MILKGKQKYERSFLHPYLLKVLAIVVGQLSGAAQRAPDEILPEGEEAQAARRVMHPQHTDLHPRLVCAPRVVRNALSDQEMAIKEINREFATYVRSLTDRLPGLEHLDHDLADLRWGHARLVQLHHAELLQHPERDRVVGGIESLHCETDHRRRKKRRGVKGEERWLS